MRPISYFIHNPYQLIERIALMVPWAFSDKCFLEILFRSRVGYKLNLKNPTTFNEKLQWIKLYDHNPLYTTMVDKFAVKKYVADKCGKDPDGERKAPHKDYLHNCYCCSADKE